MCSWKWAVFPHVRLLDPPALPPRRRLSPLWGVRYLVSRWQHRCLKAAAEGSVRGAAQVPFSCLLSMSFCPVTGAVWRQTDGYTHERTLMCSWSEIEHYIDFTCTHVAASTIFLIFLLNMTCLFPLLARCPPSRFPQSVCTSGWPPRQSGCYCGRFTRLQRCKYAALPAVLLRVVKHNRNPRMNRLSHCGPLRRSNSRSCSLAPSGWTAGWTGSCWIPLSARLSRWVATFRAQIHSLLSVNAAF